MKILSPVRLLEEIRDHYPKFSQYIPRLEKLAMKHPDVLVALSVGGGDCEADGVIAPITEDGDIDKSRKRYIREGEPMEQEPFVWVPDR